MDRREIEIILAQYFKTKEQDYFDDFETFLKSIIRKLLILYGVTIPYLDELTLQVMEATWYSLRIEPLSPKNPLSTLEAHIIRHIDIAMNCQWPNSKVLKKGIIYEMVT